MIDFLKLPSPCYVLDEELLDRNLATVDRVRRESGAEIIVALKACAMWSIFPELAKHSDGATASSAAEARLVFEEFGRPAHTYAPVYTDSNIDEILNCSDHITFNSLSQFRRFGQKALINGISCGLRINPQYSPVETDLYNPCVGAYNAENYQEGKFAKANEEMTRNSQQANIAMSVMNPGMNLAMNGLTLGIYWIGAALISAIAVTSPAAMMERIGLFSDMVVFMQYAMQVIMAFLMLVMIFVMLPRVTVSAGRVNEVLDTKARIVDGKETQGKPGMKGEIEFRDVSFRYPDADGDTIHHISFTAHHGQTVALIGATGCGKSSIINLIPRLYDATSGQVLVDGVDVRDYTQDALRSKIGFVPQKAFLFAGTVSSNVGYGEDNASGAAIRKAVAIAQAAEFVESPEVGYSGTVAQGGSNFSGGQKQRLSIARAVARDPEILVFDDSFSALDYKTDHALRQALREQTSGTTNIIVAQRIGTIRDADCILVIEDGAIVGKGTHRELMESCKVYQEIAYSQLSKEELAS